MLIKIVIQANGWIRIMKICYFAYIPSPEGCYCMWVHYNHYYKIVYFSYITWTELTFKNYLERKKNWKLQYLSENHSALLVLNVSICYFTTRQNRHNHSAIKAILVLQWSPFHILWLSVSVWYDCYSQITWKSYEVVFAESFFSFCKVFPRTKQLVDTI